MEKKIRISLDDDISSKTERLGQNTATSLEKVADAYDNIDDVIDGLIKDSEKYNVSLKERISLIEREIKLQERSARQDYTHRKQRPGQTKRESQRIHSERYEELDYYDKLRERFESKKASIHPTVNSESLKQHAAEFLGKMAGIDKKGGSDDDDDDSEETKRRRRRDAITSRIGGGLQAAGNGALAAAGFGAVLSIGGFVGKMIDESRQLDESRNRLSGKTGGVGVGGSAFGMKESALMDYANEVATARGEASGSEAMAQLGMEKGFGMGIGSTNSFNKVLRADSSTTLVDATVDMLNIMKKTDLYNIKRGDFSQLHELLERQNALNEIQSTQTEEVNARNSSLLMGSLGKVGGSFSDFRQGQTLSSINSSITNPDNDFKQAFLLRTLRQNNSGASFLDLKMKQEEGIFGKGTLSGIMSNLSDTFSGEQLTFSTSKMLGLNLSQSKKLQDYYSGHKDMFDNMEFDSEDDFKKWANGGFTKGGVKARGGAKTGTIEGWSSGFDTWTGQKGDAAVKYASELQGAYEQGGFGGMTAKLGSDIVNAIKSGFKEAYDAATGNDSNKKAANALFGNSEVQADLKSALGKMSESEFSKYEDAILGGGGMTTKKGKIIDIGNAESHGEYAKAVEAILTKYMPEKYKGIDDDGKVIKVHVVNTANKSPKNTTHTGKHN